MSEEIEVVTPTAVETQEAKQLADRQEADTIDLMRTNMLRAAEIEKTLLERAEHATGRDLPGALRAVADVKAKNVDKLLALTNRVPGEGAGPDLGELLGKMVDKGYLRVNVDLDGRGGGGD